MIDLWLSPNKKDWQRALGDYERVVADQGVARLAELDDWYRNELPALIAARDTPHVTHAELIRATEWKMARGVWRAPNLILVRGNASNDVASTSGAALAAIPDPKKPIATLATLAGIGPATASAVVAATAPDRYPFFDELVAGQILALGKVAWTLGYYVRYADAIRDRASALGEDWTPVAVERALWANVGGKAGARAK
jgi:hypothetical protein